MRDARPGLRRARRRDRAESLKKPTWNGEPLKEVYPWGTIRTPTPSANRATATELSAAEQAEIRARTWQYLETFDYKSFLTMAAAA